MAIGLYEFPARLEPDEEGRLVVHFPDLPEALTDGADEAEARAEAPDCLSEALAGRINRGEDIPPPSRLRRGQHWVAPDTTMALKAALYNALRIRNMTVADLTRCLGIDERKASRLIHPRTTGSWPVSKLPCRRSAMLSASRFTKSRRRDWALRFTSIAMQLVKPIRDSIRPKILYFTRSDPRGNG